MLHDIYLALSGLKLASKVNGKLISLTPDILYQHFIEFLSLLLPQCHILVVQHWHYFL